MNTSLDLSIFRDYDIRGIYPTQVNEPVYYTLGRAIATYFSVPEIAVGHDTRLSSPALFDALTRGIMDQGTHVANLGLISTEMHYFASGKFAFPANVIISASHNPPQYNGVKIVKKGVVPLHGSFGFPEIRILMQKNVFPSAKQKGTMRRVEMLSEWISHTLSFVETKKLRPLRLVVDAGNGMGGISWKEMQGKLPVTIIPLYFEPDGRFPHHLPDPLDPRNLTDLKEKIIQEHADLGFALDGDADRLFVLDETGRIVSGTITTALLAQHLLKKFGPSNVLYNVVCGRIVPETVTSLGGTPIRVRVGHSFIKQYMKEKNALFAGEHSGHFYFRDNFFADSSLIAGLVFLELLSFHPSPLSAIVKTFDKYPSSGEINFRVKDTKAITQAVEEKHRDAATTDHIDGLSLWYKDWWCNIRASKTEPLLRLNVEADSQDILSSRVAQLNEEIKSQGGEQREE